jgi:putative tricarboxylic transport membrane protein
MLTRDRIGALLMLAFSLGYGAMSFRIPLLPFQTNQAFTARTIPEALAVLGVLLSLAILLKPLSPAAREADATWRVSMRKVLGRFSDGSFPLGKVAALCVLMAIYGLTVRPLGFLASTTILLSGGMLILGERRYLMIALTTVGVVVFFWTLMTQFLDVYIAPLPEFFGTGR